MVFDKISKFHCPIDSDLICRYSSIWLGRALPDDGTLVTLEIDEKHAQVCIDLVFF